MIEALRSFTHERRDGLLALLDRCFALGRESLLQSDLSHVFGDLLREDPSLAGTALEGFARCANEAALRPPWAYFAVREGIARWSYLRVHRELLAPEAVGVAEFLRFKERLVDGSEGDLLEIDFGPFGRGFPRLTEETSIGNGVWFLNRELSARLFVGGDGRERLREFLTLHTLEGRNLLLQRSIPTAAALRLALRQGLALVRLSHPDTPWRDLQERLAGLGFAPGWGDTAARVVETLELLVHILEAPSPAALEEFLSRIPMISRLLVVSPHGFFGQANVLGMPDTGGQVVYILDQVRALEHEMRERLRRQGVDVEPQIVIVTRLIPEAQGTTCDQRIEKVSGCESTRILRVPFRRPNGEVVREWISRFHVWPYLDGFAREVEREAPAELGGRPDLIIGNYSDGNLVATLLAERLGVTQCNIAHALEKTKYLLSDLHWKDNEAQYRFSCQYTADLIAMNAADFIVTSTYQEIAGTERTMGQYESYVSFTMPGLYRVLDGVDLYDPKFNIVSPGAAAGVFFAYTEEARRLVSLEPKIEAMVFGGPSEPGVRGALADPEKPLVFTMARLDRIKNLTGLVEWYANSDRLRSAANLLVVGGSIDPGTSSDAEERPQIERLHDLMSRHALDGQVRWVGRRLDRNLSGELYRFVADRRGVFVQPALFEAFGLTVIESMASGLPTFATVHGGPSEIIQPGVSGFTIDPTDGAAAAESIAAFLERAAADPEEWLRISRGALARVEARYTWRRYAERMMTLARVYGFWKYVSRLDRQETLRYLQMFYALQLRPLAAAAG